MLMRSEVYEPEMRATKRDDRDGSNPTDETMGCAYIERSCKGHAPGTRNRD